MLVHIYSGFRQHEKGQNNHGVQQMGCHVKELALQSQKDATAYFSGK